VSRVTKITGPLLALVERAGGVEALASELGVTRGTIHRWATGERVPALIVRRAINDWARRRGLEGPFKLDK